MANITLDKLKTIVQSIVASVTRYKPNLSVNDPDDPRYVAGRLCYKAKKTVEEVPETTVTFAEHNGLYMAALTSMPGVQAIGDVRTVVWDGVAYVCKAGDYSGRGLALGNRSLYNAMTGESNPDTGEPFVWGMSPAYGISVLMTLDAAETHTVSCWADKEVVHTLPKEYLPQIPAEKVEGLAEVVTTANTAKTTATNAQTTANAALPQAGGTLTGTLEIRPAGSSRSVASLETDGRIYGAKMVLEKTVNGASGNLQFFAADNNAPQVWVGRSKENDSAAPAILNFIANAAAGGVHLTGLESVELRSPNGTKYKLSVDDSGTLSATAVTEEATE